MKWFLVFTSAMVVLCGCQTAPPPPSSQSQNPGAVIVRNNACSLLYQLFEEQKDVSILRFFKEEDTDLKNLTKRIALDSKEGGKQLAEFAKQDPTLVINAINLPPGEVATRAGIKKMKESSLLKEKKAQFKLTLLLSQTEALNYAWHLALVAAANESNPARARAFNDLAGEMENLYNQAYDMILSLR